MSGGTGYGHGGPVGEILAVLPTDSTFHITDCGYDDNDGHCGCYDLPSKLRSIIATAIAAALTDAGDADVVERAAEVLSWSSGEFTRYNPDAIADHNRWSWRGDGHGEVLRETFRQQARDLAAAGLLAPAAQTDEGAGDE